MTSCAYQDVVIAVMIDGDLTPPPLQDGDWERALANTEIVAHSETCLSCQRGLAAARQIDATLAASTDIAGESLDREALFAAVGAALQEEEGESKPSATKPLVLFAVTVLLGGFALGWLVFSQDKALVSELAEAALSKPEVIATEAKEPEAPDGFLRLPAGSRGLREVWQPQVADKLAALELFGRANVWSRSFAKAPWGKQLEHISGEAIAEASAALRVAQPDHLTAITDLFRSDPEGLATVSLRAQLRQRPQLARAMVRRQATEPMGLALPVLLQLDCELSARNLRQRVGRDFSQATAVAIAMKELAKHAGRVELLYGLWRRSFVAKESGNELAYLRLWFEGQAPECDQQLRGFFEASRNGPQRRWCLLALGLRQDDSNEDFFLELLHSPRRNEAFLAAWALGRLPGAEEQVDLLDFSRRLAPLLAAAAVARGDRNILPWLERARLNHEFFDRYAGQATDLDTFERLVQALRRVQP